MAINDSLFRAILAMDAYNRGYARGIDFLSDSDGTQIGGATIRKSDSSPEAQAAGFYAISYEYGTQKIISYRGTDKISNIPLWDDAAGGGSDMWNGYGTGSGSANSLQSQLALKFYKAVAGSGDPRLANIFLTGHSLGGGLAGYISALYNQPALLFNNMAYQGAAKNANFAATNPDSYAMLHTTLLDPSGSKAKADALQLKSDIYGTATPWAPIFGAKTIYMDGEFLSANRALQTGVKTPYTLESDVPLSTLGRHNMDTLIIVMFGKDSVATTDWLKAEKYLINSLYSNTVGGLTGAKTVTGTMLNNEDYAGIMRTAIAYSAIDSGEMPFGNTGIRALFNDANEWGKVLKTTTTTLSDITKDFAGSVSDIYTQFAGKLAIDRVLQANSPKAVDGVLKLYADEVHLDIDFGNKLWGIMPTIVGRTELFNNIFAGRYSSGIDVDNVDAAMQRLWGSSSKDIFEHVILATSSGGGTVAIADAPSTGKADLFVGSLGVDTVTGSSGNDLLLGYDGGDELTGGTGNDILVGGKGDDLLIGGAGNDVFILNDDEGLDIINGGDAGDQVVYNGVRLNGNVQNIENGVYTLNGFALTRSKDGDLTIYSPDDLTGGVVIDGFFPAGYNGDSFTKMGMGFSKADEHLPEDYVHSPTQYIVPKSPIVLDLNGDGIKYIPYSHSSYVHAHFDLDNDGFAEGVEWIDKNDGFLVRDLNGNGAIDNQKEMFGDDSGTTAYAKLALLDTNKNSKIDSGDSGFATLKIWQDLDSDGKTDAGELKTLAQAGISSLSLQLTNATTDASGHAIAGTSTFTRSNGTVGNAADVILTMNNGDTFYVGSDTANPPQLDLSTLFLPLYRGHGTLKPLHYAMTDNPVLKQMVVGLVNIDIKTQMHEVYDRVNSIIMEWAGVTGMLPTGQETNQNAAKLAVIKKYFDTDTPPAGVDIAYNKIFLDVLTKLLVQGPLHKAFPESYYRYDYNELGLVSPATVAATTDFTAAVKKLFEGAKIYEPTNPLDKSIYWDVILHIVQTTTYGVPDISVAESVAGINLNDSYYTLIGTSGDDVLTTNNSSFDDFKGLKGNDVYNVGDTSNIYYNLGDGNDTIIRRFPDSSSLEMNIYFGVGISFDSMTFQYVSNPTTSGAKDLIITIPGSGSIRVAHMEFAPIMNFADGSVKDYADVNYKIYGGMGTAGDDKLYGISGGVVMKGFAGNDSLKGGTGNDTIYGGDGNDGLYGDAGNDKLYGENGDDSINGGAGADIIDGGAGSDTVVYYLSGAVNVNLGITTAQSGGDAQGDTLISIENIIGSNDSDTLVGNSGDNVIQGRKGWDKIDGGAGNDTVVYSGTAVNINLSLTTAQVSGGGEGYGDTLINVENIIGTGGNDILTGNSGDNVIEGGYGADIIDGGVGIDTASYKTSIAAVSVNLGVTTAQSGGSAAGDTLFNIENIIGSAYADTLKGNSGSNIISGGAGADKIDGSTGTDTVSYAASAAGVNVNLGITTAQSGGDAQGDTLISIENIIGSPLNDSFISSSVANKLDGGAGIDTVSYTSSTAAVNVNLGVTTAQAGGYAAGDTLISIENIIGSPLNDTLTGSSVANIITGGAGADKIDGGSGVDTVSYAGSNAAVNVNLAVTTAQAGGHAAGDTLLNIESIIGSSYGDTLKGNSIANIITGGSGNDTMTGGSGADLFKYSAITDSGKASGARDIITDFVRGTDKIDLADFAGTFTFKGTGALGGSVHGVNYAQVSGNTIIGIDADGNGTLDMQIQLTGLHALTASDFLL